MATVQDIRQKAGEEPITMLTAYDAPTAELVEEAGVDAILVGDSAGNAMMGYDSTLPVTMEDMVQITGTVTRATDELPVIADMPFLSFGAEEAETVENAGRFVKEANADAVKLESGPHTVEVTRTLTRLGIPVMAHLGLTPQRVKQLGGYGRQGTTTEAAAEMLDLALAHEEAGAFSLILEHVPANVAAEITAALEIPTIGIGAGPDTDGQVLVVTDVLGLSEHSPGFSRQFGDVRSEMADAIDDYRAAVESGEFPAEEHSHVESGIDGIADESDGEDATLD